jgi:hypothetical protein
LKREKLEDRYLNAYVGMCICSCPDKKLRYRGIDIYVRIQKGTKRRSITYNTFVSKRGMVVLP